MASRLKLIVSYDGSPFSGWQSQPNGNGVQDHLENAFEQICSQRVRVHGAGRTDAGVHALAQCAHADLPVKRYEAERWRSALNGVLPTTIRVMRSQFVPEPFHARFSAKGKVYRYRVWNEDVMPPLENNRAWHVRERIEYERVASAAKLFVGRHDFASFAANRGAPVEDTVRTLLKVSVRKSGPLLTLYFEGDGFLYKMVRLMVGTLVQIGRGEMLPSEIKSRLAHSAKANTRGRNVAPPGGLFLIRVRY